VKLIAEPWDIGEGGYQVGNFPPLFAEWNDHYRDATRRFWLERSVSLGNSPDALRRPAICLNATENNLLPPSIW
jgi:pullulanase/glycogen debranching enzyme